MLLANSKIAIGNSSSFVRDASILGIPVVLIGDRQKGRETGDNVLHCSALDINSIIDCIKTQMSKKRFKPSDLYGKPGVSKKIADALSSVKIYNQKHLHYVNEQSSVALNNR
jgi:UDP-N-acetylglucosamine 2-epimerase